MGNFLSKTKVAIAQRAYATMFGMPTSSSETSSTSLFDFDSDDSSTMAIGETARERPDPSTYSQLYRHPAAQHPRAWKSMYAGPAATVIVGPEKVEFSVQMSLLFHFSKMAERALNGHFREARGNTLHLPEMDPDAFCFFLRCMYQGQLGVYKCCRRPDDNFFKPTEESSIEICTILCRLYVLVDYLDCPYQNPIQGEILDQLQQTIDEAIALERSTPIIPSTLLYVSRNTVAGSFLHLLVFEDLRRELAKMYPRNINEYAEYIDENPREFREEIVARMISGFHWGVYQLHR